MTYDYVSIAKHSIFDYDDQSSDWLRKYEYPATAKHSTHVNTSKQNNFLPIVCVKLFGSTDNNGRNGKPVSATYAERQTHKAAIPERHCDIRRMKLQALHASVKLWDMTIHYNNGRKQLVELTGIIHQNSESPLIDLKEQGGIESITFALNAVTFSDKSPVLWIWGG